MASALGRARVAAVWLAASAFGGAACSSTEARSVPVSECDSGTKWVGDESASPRMHPGRDCTQCHASNHYPSYTLEGTVFGVQGQANDCFGLGDVTVEITDANGVTSELSTNEAGNFFTPKSVALPYRAKVRSADGERVMLTPQTTGSCNSCHTAEGVNGAPGRIIAP
jgi:hypothetical protein